MSVKNDWQAWALGALLALISIIGTGVVTSYAENQQSIRERQDRLEQELAKKTTDIEVLKVEMRNQTELMKAMNSVLQQLVRAK